MWRFVSLVWGGGCIGSLDELRWEGVTLLLGKKDGVVPGEWFYARIEPSDVASWG